jgi:hypothetical protein
LTISLTLLLQPNDLQLEENIRVLEDVDFQQDNNLEMADLKPTPTSPEPTTNPSTPTSECLNKPARLLVKTRAPSDQHNTGLFKFFHPISHEQHLDEIRKENLLSRDEREEKYPQHVQNMIMAGIEKTERVKMLARERKRAQRAREKAKV